MRNNPLFVLAYHGTTQSVAERIIAHEETFQVSQNKYDWLGSGVYFWENSCYRAFEWAKKLPTCEAGKDKPAVVGALISLRDCLDLNDLAGTQRLKDAYAFYCAKTPEKNQAKNSPRARQLDYAVIETLHEIVESGLGDIQPYKYKVVRASFPEGKPIYAGSAFQTNTHIQLCVRDLDAVICYFKPVSGEFA